MRNPYLLALLILTSFLSLNMASCTYFHQQNQLRKAEELSRQAGALSAKAHYDEAIPLAANALAIQEEAFGPDHRYVAGSLLRLARLYYFMGDYFRAEPLYQRALAIREKTFGPNHPAVADSLNPLALLYRSLADYSRAEPLYQRALAIREKTLGPNHPDVAVTLHDMANLYVDLGDYSQAEPLHQRALAIREKTLGPNHPAVADSLGSLAMLYFFMGDYSRAEPMHQRALAIREKTFGPNHPAVADSLNPLALLYRSLGDYSRAELLYLQTLAIREKALGQDHPSVAGTLNDMANLYVDLGDYSRAEPLFQRALAIRERAFGPDHRFVADSLNSLASLYRDSGRYSQAEPLYQQGLAIREKIFGPNHPAVAKSLNPLAGLYCSLGDYSRAEPLYQRALSIREKSLGPNHPEVAGSLNDLANLYRDSGDYSRAEPLYQQALAIREKALGQNHPAVAGSLHNLAFLYYLQMNYSRAEPLYQRALAIREKTLGPNHPAVAGSLTFLANLYRDIGDYHAAEPLYQRSLAIRVNALGPDHPYVALSLNNFAALYAAQGDYQNAHGLLKRAQEVDGKLIDEVMGFTSEDQKMKFLITRRQNLFSFLSLITQHFSTSPSACKDALDVWLRRKGVILDSQKRFQDALLYSDHTEAVNLFLKLARVRAQLSKVVFSERGEEGLAAYRGKIMSLQKEKEDLETKLCRLSQAFATGQKIAKADCKKVARALPSKTALIDFARVDIRDFKATGKERRWLPAHYLGFVLPAGEEFRVGMLDFGEAEEIDRLISQLKRWMTGGAKQFKSKEVLEASTKIYDMVFDPLRRELGDVKEVFISPDGNLNLIPFEVLRGPDGRYLIEDYTFNYLSSGRDVLGFGEIQEKGGKALIMGDPNFDLRPDEKDSSLRRLALKETKEEEGMVRSSEMRGFRFSRLPGTREEVAAICSLLGEGKAELYTEEEALEEVLRQKGAPNILHLATHGFFLSDMDRGRLRDEERGIDEIAIIPESPGKDIQIENPLIRTGIALAGANQAITARDLAASDGVVTAEKILGLRLRGTDMVVLSACETGLGEVKIGEGVFGLRRAFTQAGARSLVMSMWSVPDRETKELMVEFYKNILTEKMNRCQALRRAALTEMKVVKERYGEPSPFYWGAFVFLGEP